MATQWQYKVIPVEHRPLVDWRNQPLRNPDGTQLGTTGSGAIAHWYAGPQGAAWVVQARKMHTQATGARDSDPSTAWARLQSCQYAIMQAYNCYNVQWHCDPEARALYRQQIAGGPNPTLPAEAEFGNQNYSQLFSGHNPAWLMMGNSFQGVVANSARVAFSSCTSASNASSISTVFVPTMQFYVNVASDIAYECNLDAGGNRSSCDVSGVPLTSQNASSVQNFSFSGMYGIYDQVYKEVGTVVWRPETGGIRASSINALGAQSTINCFRRSPSDVLKWDTYQFDQPGVFNPNPATAGALGDYASWMDRWISSLESRTPEEVILDARAYAVFVNANVVHSWGGSQGFASAIQSMNDQLGAIHTSAQSTIATATQAVGALAGAAVAAGLAAASAVSGAATMGIGALVGGAIIAIGALSGALIVSSSPDNVPLDDLRRPKPWFERGWLSGDPGDQSANGAPSLVIPDPPGWTSTSALYLGHNLSPAMIAALLQSPPAPPGRSSPSTGAVPEWVWIAGGLAVAGGSVYAGYRMTQGQGSSGRSSRRTSRRSR